MEFVVEPGEMCVVKLHGEIDHAQAPRLRSELRRLVDEGHDHIGIDFSDVTFLDSSGVSQLVFAFQDVPSNVTVTIVGASRPVRRVFTVLGYAGILPNEDDIQPSRVLRYRLFDPYVRSDSAAS